MPDLVSIGELVLDEKIYPRRALNLNNVNQLSHALRAGHKLPPVVADRVSRRLVDGWHRWNAHRNVFGDDAKIAVEWRDYASERELFVDCVRLNVTHGQSLGSAERALAAQRLEVEFKLEPREIASVLCTQEKQVMLLLPRWAEIPEPNQVGSGTYRAGVRVRTPLKTGMRHLRQQELTAEQFEAHQHLGYSPLRSVSQVISSLNGDLFDWESERTRDRLCLLRQELEAALELHGIVCEP